MSRQISWWLSGYCFSRIWIDSSIVLWILNFILVRAWIKNNGCDADWIIVTRCAHIIVLKWVASIYNGTHVLWSWAHSSRNGLFIWYSGIVIESIKHGLVTNRCVSLGWCLWGFTRGLVAWIKSMRGIVQRSLLFTWNQGIWSSYHFRLRMHLNILASDQQRAIWILLKIFGETYNALTSWALGILLVFVQIPIAKIVTKLLLALVFLLLLMIVTEHCSLTWFL